MSFIQLPGGAVHYREMGQGQTIILLHANPGDSQDFAAVIPALAQHYRVLALDWPGYGLSPAQADFCGASNAMQLLADFIQVLNCGPVILLGNSLGGNAAVQYAARYPQNVSRLILISPGGFTAHNFFTRLFCRWQASRFALPPSWFARIYLRKKTSVTKAMWQRAAGSQSTAATRILNRRIWRSFSQPASDVRALARNLRQPVLLIFGAFDPVIPAWRDGRQARACIADADLHTLPCGHAAFAEVPVLFLESVFAFLDCSADQSAEKSLQQYK
ncbi:MAG: alpha/beta hydrolase [Oceanospirillaceae bacterium]|nr:alpha/beta hydrolase [Oceanospirillaceae bacterium]MCP5349610.1 alpha/beta hydrolase [Oceanospirillaceae bacterium]